MGLEGLGRDRNLKVFDDMRLNGLTAELNIDKTEKVAEDWVLLTQDNSTWVDEE